MEVALVVVCLFRCSDKSSDRLGRKVIQTRSEGLPADMGKDLSLGLHGSSSGRLSLVRGRDINWDF